MRDGTNIAFCPCPPDVDGLAEEYCLNRLPLETAEAFEDHYLSCPDCASVAEQAHRFIEAFRQTAVDVKNSDPVRKFR